MRQQLGKHGPAFGCVHACYGQHSTNMYNAERPFVSAFSMSITVVEFGYSHLMFRMCCVDGCQNLATTLISCVDIKDQTQLYVTLCSCATKYRSNVYFLKLSRVSNVVFMERNRHVESIICIRHISRVYIVCNVKNAHTFG